MAILKALFRLVLFQLSHFWCMDILKVVHAANCSLPFLLTRQPWTNTFPYETLMSGVCKRGPGRKSVVGNCKQHNYRRVFPAPVPAVFRRQWPIPEPNFPEFIPGTVLAGIPITYDSIFRASLLRSFVLRKDRRRTVNKAKHAFIAHSRTWFARIGPLRERHQGGGRDACLTLLHFPDVPIFFRSN